MRFISVTLFTAALFLSSAVSASILEFIDNGRTTIVNDYGNFTEWLDLTETQNSSFNDIENDLMDGNLSTTLMESGEIADGWRYASIQDVEYLLFLYFFDPISGVPELTAAKFADFVSLFGDTVKAYAPSQSTSPLGLMGLTNTDDPADDTAVVAVQVFASSQTIIPDWQWFKADAIATGGSWLIRDYQVTNVSAPASIGLFLLALAGIGYRRKK